MHLENCGIGTMPWKGGFLRVHRICPHVPDSRCVPNSSAEETQSGLAWKDKRVSGTMQLTVVGNVIHSAENRDSTRTGCDKHETYEEM